MAGKKYEKYLIGNIKKAINKTYFLHLYESVHFKSVFEAMKKNVFYFLIIDKPDQLDSAEYRKAIKESGYFLDKNIYMQEVKSDFSLGIQVADCFAGAINDFLKGTKRNQAKKLIIKYKNKLLSFSNKPISKVMWEGDHDYECKEILTIKNIFKKKHLKIKK